MGTPFLTMSENLMAANAAEFTDKNQQLAHMTHQQLLDRESTLVKQIHSIKKLHAEPIDWTQIMNVIVSHVPVKMQLKRLEYMKQRDPAIKIEGRITLFFCQRFDCFCEREKIMYQVYACSSRLMMRK